MNLGSGLLFLKLLGLVIFSCEFPRGSPSLSKIKSAELSPWGRLTHWLHQPLMQSLWASLQNANPNPELLFSVTLKCNFSMSIVYFYRCVYLYLLSCKKPFAICMLMQHSQHQLGALPPKTSSAGLFAKLQWVKGSRVNSAPPCPSWQQTPATLFLQSNSPWPSLSSQSWSWEHNQLSFHFQINQDTESIKS